MARQVGLSLLVAAAALAGAAAAEASCVFSTPEEQKRRAAVIFDGVALEGPTASGRQRFEVRRYLKGDGPDVVEVATGVTRRADGTGSLTSVSLDVAAGDAWRIFGQWTSAEVVRSSSCDGSRRLASTELPAAVGPTDQARRSDAAAVIAVLAAVALVAAATLVWRRRRMA